jgi:hypothetical protein
MDQLVPSLTTLVEAFRGGFHPQVFQTFHALLAGWIVCLGPHTISGFSAPGLLGIIPVPGISWLDFRGRFAGRSVRPLTRVYQ